MVLIRNIIYPPLAARFCSSSSSALKPKPPAAAESSSSSNSNSNLLSSTTSPSIVVRTARNVITSSGILQDTMDDLYGENGTVGIADWKRFSLLNEYLRGFRLGELTILTGPTGSGKTTFLSEYSLDLAQRGVRTLWCNFELKNSRLCAMMVRQMHSTFELPLDPASMDRRTVSRMVADLSDKLPILFAAFNGPSKVDSVIAMILEQSDLAPVHHVVVDNLQFMLGSGGYNNGDNPFRAQDALFERFRTLATRRNIHVTMVIHPRKFDNSDIDRELSVHSLYGGAKASQEADNILLIQTRRAGPDHPFSKYLQIAKNRYFGNTYLGDRLQLAFHKASQRHRLTWKKSEYGQQQYAGANRKTT